MTNKYDAIIVGSGLGGLTAAATLAKNGQRVAVFERHSQPGGYATTFFRDGFEFEISLHAMSGIGTEENPGPLRPFFKELGVMERVNFIPMNNLYRTISDELDITVPKSPESAKAVLMEAFPEEAAGIEAFIDHIMVVGEEAQLLKEGNYSTRPIPTLARFPHLAHAAGSTVSDVLDKYISGDLTKLALGQLWGYFGLPPSKLSFLLFAAGVSSYLKWGSVTIEGKSQSLSNALAQIIRENGGEVHLAEGVKKILVDDGKVRGIISDYGITYNSDTVVSNADPYATLNKLIAPEHVPPKYKRRIEAAAPSAGSVTLYLGLNRPSREVGIASHELYLNRDVDMDTQWNKCQSLTRPGVISVCAYDNSNPQFAPDGKGVIAVTVLSMGDIWTQLSPDQYTLEKRRFGDMLLGELEKAFPGVSNAVETRLVSTPITNMRYTGNSGGAIYGFASTPQENPGFRMNNQGPVIGLWFAGAWTRPSAGYQGVITSGINTANDILAKRNVRSTLPVAASAPPQSTQRAMRRRLRGFGHVLRDGKRVGKVIRSKYRKYSNEPLEPQFKNQYDRVEPYHARNIQMKIGAKYNETYDTVTLRLLPDDYRIPAFSAGQYVEISTTIDGNVVSRAYSISSAPEENRYIDITVKVQPGGTMSSYLVYNTRVGDHLSVLGPFGEFTFNPLRDSNDVVAIAVGSGITPFMSMMKSMARRDSHPSFELIYGSRREEEIIFRREINDICDADRNMKVTHVLSSASPFWPGVRGRVNADQIKRLLPERLDRKTFFICGPSEMQSPIVNLLRERRVPLSQIHYESFAAGSSLARPDSLPSNALVRTIELSGWNPKTAPHCHLSQNPKNREKQAVSL
ncbi:MAG: FAD-dependent oxidoreductase [Deltaproteobacteria bacterium]|nr:FAD-dependent oxidoreductase [Deltaproteobacteria bacterium]MBN2674120.1 FAD-dependent oxidoreductase [Deltaproteobacteria bacterium]